MAEKQKVKCIGCEEEFEVSPDCPDIAVDEEGNEVYLTWTDLYALAGENEPVCEGCKENDTYYLTSIVKYGPKGKEYVAKIGDYNAWIEANGYYDFEGDKLQEAYSIVKNRKWKPVDAWRGYYSLDGVNHQFKVATSGWVTGYPDRTVSYKEFTYQLYEHLQEYGCPVPVWWVFSVTSNLFSTAAEIIILKKDEKAFWEWIKKEFDQDKQEVKRAFS